MSTPPLPPRPRAALAVLALAAFALAASLLASDGRTSEPPEPEPWTTAALREALDFAEHGERTRDVSVLLRALHELDALRDEPAVAERAAREHERVAGLLEDLRGGRRGSDPAVD